MTLSISDSRAKDKSKRGLAVPDIVGHLDTWTEQG
jgi:hypothetical protein